MPEHKSRIRKLDKDTIAEITRQAEAKLGEYGKTFDILGEYIFTILELNCHVLMYPLTDKDIWGFLERINDKQYICINSALEREKQVFVAAHELYHLWYNHGPELITGDNLDARNCDTISLNEMKANRFAAEFLIPEPLLRKEIQLQSFKPKTMDVKEILVLANSFIVPYRTMVKRLCEIGIFTEAQTFRFLDMADEEVTIWRNRLGFNTKRSEGPIKIANLVDIAMKAYERKLITRDKLEYFLSFSNLDSTDVGLEPLQPPTFPQEDDIREILEDVD